MASNNIRGTVTDGSGNPVAGATVVAFEQDNITNIASTTTDTNGNYIIDNSLLTGDGPWHVTARWEDGSGNQFNSLSKPYVSANIIAIPDSGVFRLTLDDTDTESGTALDAWNDFDATNNGATTGVSGANQTYATNEAYELDGTGDYLVRDSSSLPDLSAPYSVSAWIYPNSISEFKDIVMFGQQANNIFNLRFSLNSDGSIKGGLFDGSTSCEAESTGTVTFDAWNHVTWTAETADPSTFAFYIDGSNAGQNVTNQDTPTFSSVDRYTVGVFRDLSLRFYDGTIDDPRTYDKELTSSEASNLYNTGSI